MLAKLLGTDPQPAHESLVNEDENDDEEELDFGGLSLRELAISEIPESDAAHVYRAQTVEDCMYSIGNVLCFAHVHGR